MQEVGLHSKDGPPSYTTCIVTDIIVELDQWHMSRPTIQLVNLPLFYFAVI